MTAMCVPKGQVKFCGSKKLPASRPGSRPSGRFFAQYAPSRYIAPWNLSLLDVFDVEHSVLEADLFGIDTHLVGGDLLCLLDDLVQAHHQGLSADCQGAASEGAGTELVPLGVTVHDLDVLHRGRRAEMDVI